MAKNQRRMEVQKRKKLFKKLIGLFLLFVLCAVIAAFTPYFNISRVNITGNSRVSAQEIEQASGIKQGSNIFRIKLSSVQRRIQEISYVHSVRVKREFPNQISIEIEESQPVAAVPYMGQYVLIDMYGKALEQETTEDMENITDIVILTGLKIKNFELGEKIIVENERNLKIVLESLSELVHNSLIENTTEIDLTEEEGIVFKMNESKLSVLMGDASDLPYRVKFLKEILNKLGGTPRGVIDFTSKDPTYRLSDPNAEAQQDEGGEEDTSEEDGQTGQEEGALEDEEAPQEE
ncbi:MAG: FtsQ-type POTRA domain-containing protein [Clostridia bacterium]|nr:FtsQ-type POTRA domain-containing protein [Clostridia bacterium]